MPKRVHAVVVDKNLCKGCHICISVCPHGVLEKSKEVDNRGFYLPEVVNLDACMACRLCEMHCPDFAIAVDAD